jgi:tetratricopeptide (TPR) repeat protein
VTGFFRRLFSKQQAEPETPSHPQERRLEIDEFGHNLVSIDALDFVGQQAVSPNKRYRLIWADRTPDGRRGGNRSEGHGSWSLLLDDRIVTTGRLERPQEGCVADNGTVILHDWMFGEGLQGRLVAFAPDGSQLVSQHFAANLMSNGLSTDGRFAICQTANAPGSADSCRYILFDLAAGREVARWEVETGWADHYEWDCEARRVYLCMKAGERVGYDFTGAMVEREAWQLRRISAGDLTVIQAVLAEASAKDHPFRSEIIEGLGVAAREGEVWQQARAYRLLGELHEQAGEIPQAVKAYNDALTIDPKVGVARRAEQLRKALGTTVSKPGSERLSRFEQQAGRLGIQHEVVLLEKGDGKDWRHKASDPWTTVELGALEHYRSTGWQGAGSEGGLILTLIKAASFDLLDARNSDTFVEALYAQNVAFEQDRFATEQLISTVAKATRRQIERNWKVLAASAGNSPAYYPTVREHHVTGLFEALGPGRLAEIATVFATAPYDLRAGWPDLTLWQNDKVKFVEVKGPGDSFHASQARLISKLLLPLGFNVSLAEVRKRS